MNNGGYDKDPRAVKNHGKGASSGRGAPTRQRGEKMLGFLDDSAHAPLFLKGVGGTPAHQDRGHNIQNSIVILGDKSVGKTCLLNRYAR